MQAYAQSVVVRAELVRQNHTLSTQATLRRQLVQNAVVGNGLADQRGHPFDHLPGGARRFRSSNQFSTTLICVLEVARSVSLTIKKRWPSGDTS